MGGPTIQDLINKINSDFTLSYDKQQELIAAVLANAPRHSTLASLGAGLLGGVVGAIAAKYFDLGFIGKALSSLAGAGIGSSIYNNF